MTGMQYITRREEGNASVDHYKNIWNVEGGLEDGRDASLPPRCAPTAKTRKDSITVWAERSLNRKRSRGFELLSRCKFSKLWVCAVLDFVV